MENKFAVFIMVHGRPHYNQTLKTLINSGYTGNVYMVADNLDNTINDYKKIYAHKLIVFDKNIAYEKYDSGDNTGDLRSTLYSANTIIEIANQMGLEYYSIMCDDYSSFEYRYISECGKKLLVKYVTNMDYVFEKYIYFLKNSNFHSIAFAQGGDFIGGVSNPYVQKRPLIRKAMNSFICSTKKPFQFMGRMNEDVTTYVNLGQKGYLFGTIPMISIVQKQTQQIKKGLTEMYLDNGTYMKSFFSVMYNPSCVKVSMMNSNHKRIHHSINWNNTTPMIIDEKHKKI